MTTDRRRVLTRLAAGSVALSAAVVLTACGGNSEASPTSAAAGSATASAVATAPVLASAGSLRIAAGYVPSPASPDVAAAYFTVVNDGGTADTLVGAKSDASSTTTMHRTEGGSTCARWWSRC